MTTHRQTVGGRRSLTYQSWVSMLARCRDPRSPYYGKLDDLRWAFFEAFLSDMGPRRRKDLTLDRIHNRRGYSKQNCRWLDKAGQRRNQSPRRRPAA